MENEKKSSRLGVRLSAIMVAVLLVVCMAVPAFAQGTGNYPADLPPLPDGDKEWLVFKDTIGNLLVDVTGVDYVRYATFASETNGWYCYAGSMNSANRVSVDIYVVSDGQWVLSGNRKLISSKGTVSWRDVPVYCTKWVTAPEVSSTYYFRLQSGGDYPEYLYTDISGYSYFIRKVGSKYTCVRFADPSTVYVSYDSAGDPFIYDSSGKFSYRNYSGSYGNWINTEYVSGKDIVYSSFVIPDGEGGQFYPPYDPPIKQIGGVLTVVLDWVGSVVSAVVSGPMSGLLILLVVPVAITLLLVAFIVIRRIIWGA